MIKIVPLEDVHKLSYDDICNMSTEELKANMVSWIEKYNNVKKGIIKKDARYDAKRTLKYISRYEPDRLEKCTLRLYQIIKHNEDTDFRNDLFDTLDQYKGAIHYLILKDQSSFEVKFFSGQHNKSIGDLFLSYFYDNEKGEDVLDTTVKRRIKEAVLSMFKLQYEKRKIEDCIVIRESVDSCEAFGKNAIKLVISFPTIYCEAETKRRERVVYLKKPLYKEDNPMEEDKMFPFVYGQWKKIKASFMRSCGQLNREKEKKTHDIVFVVDDDNSQCYKYFVQYIAFVDRKKIFYKR